MPTVAITDVDELLLTRGAPVRSLDHIRAFCSAMDVSVVLWSSRSRPDLAAVRTVLGFQSPCFVENGSALIVPPDYMEGSFVLPCGMSPHGVIEFGCSRSRVERILLEAAAVHGLPLQIPPTPTRDYDQPFRLTGTSYTDRVALARALRSADLSWTRSDEGDHANGVVDPQSGIRLLRMMYESAFGAPVTLLGFGRSSNHVPLLQEADFPVIVRHPDRRVTERLQRRAPHATVIGAGPRAWTSAVARVVALRSRAASDVGS